MRRAPSIVALLTAVAACGLLATLVAVELRDSRPPTSPRTAIGAAAAERADARAAGFASQDRSWDATFDDGMVRDRVRWSAPGYPSTLDLTVVNATPGADLADTARACAAVHARRTRVQCYVFANTEAYEFKNITGELSSTQPTAIVNLCWAVLASNERAGGRVTLSDMRDAPAAWAAQQCPETWVGSQGAGR